MKYAVVSATAFDTGKMYIGPGQVFDKELAHQRADFAAEAYGEAQIILELRPVKRVAAKRRRGR